jgi:hypothetical protein
MGRSPIVVATENLLAEGTGSSMTYASPPRRHCRPFISTDRPTFGTGRFPSSRIDVTTPVTGSSLARINGTEWL